MQKLILMALISVGITFFGFNSYAESCLGVFSALTEQNLNSVSPQLKDAAQFLFNAKRAQQEVSFTDAYGMKEGVITDLIYDESKHQLRFTLDHTEKKPTDNFLTRLGKTISGKKEPKGLAGPKLLSSNSRSLKRSGIALSFTEGSTNPLSEPVKLNQVVVLSKKEFEDQKKVTRKVFEAILFFDPRETRELWQEYQPYLSGSSQ